MQDATLHMLCGKIAAGKSTLTARLSAAPNTVSLSEDDWLPRLYPGQIAEVADYVRHASRLREAIGPHVEVLPKAGLSVVLDFPGNTVTDRARMRGIIERSARGMCCMSSTFPIEVCRTQLHARNASGQHAYAASDAEFDAITAYFAPPTADEGFNVVAHGAD